MSQSTLISIVLAVIIIAIFLVDYFKNIKKDPIEEGIKEFVEKESGKKSWYKTNKLFWLLPVSYILSILFMFSFYLITEDIIRECLNLDTTKEITHSNFDKLYTDHLNNQISIDSIYFINKNYENVYFIKTSNITSFDKLEKRKYIDNNNYKAADLLQMKFDESEEINIYKLYLEEYIPLISNNLMDKYWEQVENILVENNRTEIELFFEEKAKEILTYSNKYNNWSLKPSEFLTIDNIWVFDEYGRKKSPSAMKKAYKEKAQEIEDFRIANSYNSLKEYVRKYTNIYERNNDIKNYLMLNGIKKPVYLSTTESIEDKNVDMGPYWLIPESLNRFSNLTQRAKIRLDYSAFLSNPFSRFNIFRLVFPLILFPFLMFFRFFFFVGGIRWFLRRKKNISMFLFLVFFLSFIFYDFAYIHLPELLIIIFALISFFVWFFNDKIKAQ